MSQTWAALETCHNVLSPKSSLCIPTDAALGYTWLSHLENSLSPCCLQCQDQSEMNVCAHMWSCSLCAALLSETQLILQREMRKCLMQMPPFTDKETEFLTCPKVAGLLMSYVKTLAFCSPSKALPAASPPVVLFNSY